MLTTGYRPSEISYNSSTFGPPSGQPPSNIWGSGGYTPQLLDYEPYRSNLNPHENEVEREKPGISWGRHVLAAGSILVLGPFGIGLLIASIIKDVFDNVKASKSFKQNEIERFNPNRMSELLSKEMERTNEVNQGRYAIHENMMNEKLTVQDSRKPYAEKISTHQANMSVHNQTFGRLAEFTRGTKVEGELAKMHQEVKTLELANFNFSLNKYEKEMEVIQKTYPGEMPEDVARGFRKLGEDSQKESEVTLKLEEKNKQLQEEKESLKEEAKQLFEQGRGVEEKLKQEGISPEDKEKYEKELSEVKSKIIENQNEQNEISREESENNSKILEFEGNNREKEIKPAPEMEKMNTSYQDRDLNFFEKRQKEIDDHLESQEANKAQSLINRNQDRASEIYQQKVAQIEQEIIEIIKEEEEGPEEMEMELKNNYSAPELSTGEAPGSDFVLGSNNLAVERERSNFDTESVASRNIDGDFEDLDNTKKNEIQSAPGDLGNNLGNRMNNKSEEDRMNDFEGLDTSFQPVVEEQEQEEPLKPKTNEVEIQTEPVEEQEPNIGDLFELTPEQEIEGMSNIQNRQNSQLAQENANLQKENEENKTNIEYLSAENDNINKELENTKQENTDLNNKLSKEQENGVNLNNENQRVKNQNQELTSRLNEANSRLNELERANADLGKTGTENNDRLNQVNEQNNSLIKNNTELNENNQILIKDNQNLMVNLNEEKKKNF